MAGGSISSRPLSFCIGYRRIAAPFEAQGKLRSLDDVLALAHGRDDGKTSGEEDFAYQVGIVVFAALGDALAGEAEIKIVPLMIAAAVGGHRVRFGEHGDVRPFAYDRLNSELEAIGEEPLERRALGGREIFAPANRRKFLKPGNNLKAEILRD